MNHGQHEAEPQNVQKRHELELAGPFIAVLSVLAMISFILPLRPETSVREKRRLREFPSFTVESLLSGEYFDSIGLPVYLWLLYLAVALTVGALVYYGADALKKLRQKNEGAADEKAE